MPRTKSAPAQKVMPGAAWYSIATKQPTRFAWEPWTSRLYGGVENESLFMPGKARGSVQARLDGNGVPRDNRARPTGVQSVKGDVFTMPGYLENDSGLCGGIDVIDYRRCEGCDNPATTSDSEGIPLCDDCYQSLVEESKADNDKKEMESGQ